MQALPDLYDVLEIVEAEETHISCSNERLACDESNLVFKALRLMGKNARVYIEKNIPIAAGLAGGSADAAAVIYAFCGASDEAFEIAKKLGADVPFCLLAIKKKGKCAAIAEGIGTELTETEPVKGKITVVTPDIAVSTPEVYKEYDRMPIDTKGGNDLEPAAIRLFPEIKETLSKLRQSGAAIVRQSGSGPSCFAIYTEEEKSKEKK